MPETVPVVSVIAPVRNDAESLRALLTRLAAQTLPLKKFEVVIADDGSTDGSATGLETRGVEVRVTTGPPLNPYAARNRAVAETRASAIASCDADCLPEPEWLEAGLSALQSAEIVAGAIEFVVPGRRSIWALLDIESFLDQERIVRSGGGVTANLFFTRTLFDLVGGFDDSLPNGGDQDFVRRGVAAGARLVFSADARVRHPARNSARQYLGKLWKVNRSYAIRERRHGRRPYALNIRWWFPIVPTLRARRRAGRPIGLDERRLAASGVMPTMREKVLGLLLLYGFIPYFISAAQAAGWARARGSGPTNVIASSTERRTKTGEEVVRRAQS